MTLVSFAPMRVTAPLPPTAGQEYSPPLTAPPTGRHVEISGISMDRFNAEGKLIEIWDQWDNFGFMGQLGLVPEAAAAS